MFPTESQKKEIRRYVQHWQKQLYLHQWEFEIMYENDEEQGVEIKMKSEYKLATIIIHKRFFELEKFKRQNIIVHELCHCIVQPLVEVAVRASNGVLTTQPEIDYQKESVTQHVASILC